MNFIFHKVRQLQHIGVANGNWVIEWLSCSSIKEFYLACIWQISTTQVVLDIFFCRSIKDRCSNLNAQGICSPSQMGFHYLPDIHAVRHTQWVKNYINRRTIRQEWHILNRQYPRYDTFVAVSPGHFVPSANFSL